MDNQSTNSVEHDYTEIVQRLSKKQKWAYGVGHVLNDICASLWFTYLIVFFHFVLGFNPVLSGTVLLIGQVADAVSTPFIGLQSDKTDDFWLCRYGRRKTWHLIGTICVMFSFPFIFSRCINCYNAEHWAQIVYYSAFIIIFQFGWAAVQISHLSMIPDLTPTEHERTELTAIRYTFTVFSNVFVYGVTWAVLHVTSDNLNNQIGPKDVYKFQQIVLIGMAVGVVASITFHSIIQETPHDSTGPIRRNLRPASSFLRDVKFYQVAVVYMATRLFVNISQIYVPLYLHDTLKMPATSLAIIPLIMYLSSFKVSLIIERINTKLGRKISYALGVLLGISACVWIWFGQGTNFTKLYIYPVSLLLGASGSMMLVTSLGVTADLIGPNTESGAFVYGAMSFTDKLSNGIVVMAIQYTLHKFNSPYYYRDVLSFVCGGAATVGLLMLISIRPLINQIEDGREYRTIESDDTFEPREVNSRITSEN
ncbi:major facilitator superfamily domain-containing protein 12 [Microplitis demolitor]|uniref:major facilitator superfamily domain-containing protein 12 n=1 Tax=Microplitis demolitor TaxID=69319 RepID=UPI0004CD7AC7|nr:major facilitator superfamily domain-containing protein 12 [Microplitis demolitor]XP_014295413.1 major facilitator superfamily domain-containing protein 12 [Microplitis demolitor]XP_053596925.1 major facilitator superfamily domain-containing protein 12 [Microplitis demolitor]